MTKNQTKNQSKARKKLKSLLSRLEKKEVVIKKANEIREWNDFLHDLELLLKDYEKDLPKNVRDILQKCLQYTDTSHEMMTPSYEATKTAINQAISSLPLSGGGLSSATIITIVVLSVVAASSSAYFITQSTTLTISNRNCETFQLSDSPVNIPGVSIPNQPIPPGDSLTISVLPIEANIDSRRTGTISLSASGVSTTVQLSDDLIDLRFNDQQILHQLYVAKFETGNEYKLELICN